MCPVKSCGMKFTVRSNCIAHGRYYSRFLRKFRTRHNRTYKPIFIDISAGESLETNQTYEEELIDDIFNEEYIDKSITKKVVLLILIN